MTNEHHGHDHEPQQRQEPPVSSRPAAQGNGHAEMPGGHMGEPHTPSSGDHSERHGAAHEHHDTAEFQRRFWVCLVLTIPVLVYAELIQDLLGYTAPSFPGSQFIPFVFASVIYFYGGSVFLRGAYDELRSRTPGMMTLVALAITVAYVYSLGTELLRSGRALYWELATLVTVMLLGHWLEMRAVGGARGAIADLAKLLPDTADRLVDDRTEEVSLDELRKGDLVLVRPGAKIPADGVVEEGKSSVNEAMITGESKPVQKGPGDQVIAGTINGSGALQARVQKTGADTALSNIMRLVEAAQQSRSHAQVLADRAAYWLTLIAIGAGVLTVAAWAALAASPDFILQRTVTVFVIACPHALGLAIPLVIAISTTLAARNGFLVRERLALEEARNVDTVMFDKTGTLTRGEQGVVGVASASGLLEERIIALAAAVEAPSEHMIARAIVAEAERRGIDRPRAREFEAMPGRGVRARANGSTVEVGGPRLLESSDQTLPPQLQEATVRWGNEGKTVVYLFADGQLQGAIALADVIREESREAVSQLKRMGVRVAMLTGDSRAVAEWVARELGIGEYFAEVLPERKAGKVHELQQAGRKVAMVGDGVNDAPALVTADVGIAIGAGTDVAIQSAGIILVKNDPRDVPRMISLSRASYRKMQENLAWAAGYNIFAIPLAAGVLAPVGIVLAPAVGALLMSASTVIVALNAQLLRRTRV